MYGCIVQYPRGRNVAVKRSSTPEGEIGFGIRYRNGREIFSGASYARRVECGGLSVQADFDSFVSRAHYVSVNGLHVRRRWIRIVNFNGGGA